MSKIRIPMFVPWCLFFVVIGFLMGWLYAAEFSKANIFKYPNSEEQGFLYAYQTLITGLIAIFIGLLTITINKYNDNIRKADRLADQSARMHTFYSLFYKTKEYEAIMGPAVWHDIRAHRGENDDEITPDKLKSALLDIDVKRFNLKEKHEFLKTLDGTNQQKASKLLALLKKYYGILDQQLSNINEIKTDKDATFALEILGIYGSLFRHYVSDLIKNNT